MRCLHCGKELALFKRLTKGEFCSDDHRQLYQRDYSQMALSRLLQAKPPGQKDLADDAKTIADKPARRMTADELARSGEITIPPTLSERPAPLKKRDSSTPLSLGLNQPASRPEALSKREPTAKQPLTTQPLAKQGPTTAETQDALSRLGPPSNPAPASTSTRERTPPTERAPMERIPASQLNKSAPPLGGLQQPRSQSMHASTEKVLRPDSAPDARRRKDTDAAPAPMAKACVELPKPAQIEFIRKEIEPEIEIAATLPSELMPKRVAELAALPEAEPMDLVMPNDGSASQPDSMGDGLELVDFTRTTRVVNMEVAPSALGTLQPVTYPVEVPAQVRLAPDSSTLWHARQYNFTGTLVTVGELARLRLPTAEVDDAETRRQKKNPPPAQDRDTGEPSARIGSEPEFANAPLISDDGLARKPRSVAEQPSSSSNSISVESLDIHSEPAGSEPVSSEPTGSILAASTLAASLPNGLNLAALASAVTMEIAEKVEAEKGKAEKGKAEEDGPAHRVPLAFVHAAPAGLSQPMEVFPLEFANRVAPVLPPSDRLSLRPVPVVKLKTSPTVTKVLKPLPDSTGGSSGSAAAVEEIPPPLETMATMETIPEEVIPEQAEKPLDLIPKEPNAESDLRVDRIEDESPERPIEQTNSAPKLSAITKAGLGIAALAILALGAYFAIHGGGRTELQTVQASTTEAPRGWAARSQSPGEWLDLNVGPKGKMSLLRPLRESADYGVEFESKLDSKPLGWVLRAQDENNFYASVLVIRKSASKPMLSVVHYAVIGGVPQSRAESMVEAPVPANGVYKVHFEAKGDRFTAFVDHQKVDEWSDGRIRIGAPGLFSENGVPEMPRGGFQEIPVRKK